MARDCGRCSACPGPDGGASCLWLGGAFAGRDRPDRLGVILAVDGSPELGRLVVLTEIRRGAAGSRRVQRIVREIRREGIAILARDLDGARAVIGVPDLSRKGVLGEELVRGWLTADGVDGA